MMMPCTYPTEKPTSIPTMKMRRFHDCRKAATECLFGGEPATAEIGTTIIIPHICCDVYDEILDTSIAS